MIVRHKVLSTDNEKVPYHRQSELPSSLSFATRNLQAQISESLSLWGCLPSQGVFGWRISQYRVLYLNWTSGRTPTMDFLYNLASIDRYGGTHQRSAVQDPNQPLSHLRACIFALWVEGRAWGFGGEETIGEIESFFCSDGLTTCNYMYGGRTGQAYTCTYSLVFFLFFFLLLK